MKFGAIDQPVTDQWTYHAVADVILAHSLVLSFPEVDPNRTALTGISWGGYLTCIVAGLDDRFKAAVPVYGCGFLDENSVWLGRFAKMSPANREVGSAVGPQPVCRLGDDADAVHPNQLGPESLRFDLQIEQYGLPVWPVYSVDLHERLNELVDVGQHLTRGIAPELACVHSGKGHPRHPVGIASGKDRPDSFSSRHPTPLPDTPSRRAPLRWLRPKHSSPHRLNRRTIG